MKYLFLLGCSLAIAAPAWAQNVAANDEEYETCCVISPQPWPTDITVLGSGSEQLLREIGQSISVIDQREVARVQGPDLTRLLERLPGVTVARSGPLGSQTSLFVRGANSQQLLVTFDGVRMADIAAPSGGFDLGTMLPVGIERIELLRGSNSVIWGSDAIGGVLAFTSAEIDGARAGFEYGAHETFSADAGLGIAKEVYAVSFSGGYLSSDGISAFAPGSESDGFRQWHGTIKGRLKLGNGLELKAVGRFADSRIEFDGYPPPTYSFADTPEYQTTRQGSGRVGLGYSSDSLTLQGGLAYSDTRRAYFDPVFGSAPNFETNGQGWRADLIGKATLADTVTLDFGADSEWTQFSTTFDSRQTARLSSGHALLGLHSGTLNLSAGARLDDQDRFGTHWTVGANGSVSLTYNLRIRASYGEGFKAPTLSQLYGYGGNMALKPEASEAVEVGIEYANRGKPFHAAFTLFRRDSSNLIDYVWPAGYFNIGRTRAQGFELEGAARLNASFTVRAAFTYLDATNRATGKELARRPRHALSASADWTTPLSGLALGVDLLMVGDSFDDAGNFTAIDGHAVLTLRARLPLGERLELYGRVENVADAQYQTVAGYGSYGRSAYAGVRLKW